MATELKKLDVDFRHGYKDRNDASCQIAVSKYQRVERCWNIYFHGFMDECDDIAYVLEKTVIEPGIYEVVVYGIPAVLYLWKYTDDHHRDLKGLIVKKDDVSMNADALEKYHSCKMFV